jgi:hypothetical protein
MILIWIPISRTDTREWRTPLLKLATSIAIHTSSDVLARAQTKVWLGIFSPTGLFHAGCKLAFVYWKSFGFRQLRTRSSGKRLIAPDA